MWSRDSPLTTTTRSGCPGEERGGASGSELNSSSVREDVTRSEAAAVALRCEAGQVGGGADLLTELCTVSAGKHAAVVQTHLTPTRVNCRRQTCSFLQSGRQSINKRASAARRLLPALAGGQLSTGSPHGLAGLNLGRGAGGGASIVLWRRRLLGNLLHQSAHPLLLLLLGHGQQQQVLRRGHVVVHWRGRLDSVSRETNESSATVTTSRCSCHWINYCDN